MLLSINLYVTLYRLLRCYRISYKVINMTVFDLGSFKTSAEKVLNNAIVCYLL